MEASGCIRSFMRLALHRMSGGEGLSQQRKGRRRTNRRRMRR